MIASPIYDSIDDALPLIRKWKDEGCSLAFTNGCFDLFHKGHIDYLLKSSTFADKLIIGLNSDASVKKIKGHSRPIQSEKSRSAILSGIKGVEMVVLFDEKTPLKMIETIRPDIIIKGGDYTMEEMIGKDLVESNGGRCEIVAFTEGYSSTDIIKKIKSKILD